MRRHSRAPCPLSVVLALALAAYAPAFADLSAVALVGQSLGGGGSAKAEATAGKPFDSAQDRSAAVPGKTDSSSPAVAAELRRAGDNSAVDVTAFTTPFREADVASQVAGVVTKVDVEEGDHVTEGQALVELKSDLGRAELEVDKARVEWAQTQVAYSEATYRTRKIEYERAQELFEKKVGSQEDRDKAKLDMDLAQVSTETAKGQKKINELTVARDEEALKQTVIRAPFAGEVFRIMNRAGEAALEQRPVVKMVCIDPLYVVAYPPIGTKDRIRAGMTASLSLENAPGKSFPCTVSIVDVAADASSGTYRVKLTLPNPDGKITAGSKGTITFKLAP